MTVPTDPLLTDPMAAWVRRTAPQLGASFEVHRINGGNSNLTYRILGESGAEVVLRCPPARTSKAGGAHDLEREYRVLRALHPTSVPVPEPLAVVSEPEIGVGYLMEFVRGITVDNDSAAKLDAAARQHLGTAMFESLARLHNLDPVEVGLGDLGAPTGYMVRQVERWASQAHAAADEESDHLKLILDIAAELGDRVPTDRPGRLVHGDFGIQNCLSGPDGKLLAVVDWELCTLGDSVADLATSLAYWTDPDDEEPVYRSSPTRLAGFPRRAELIERYAAIATDPLPDLGPYAAFSYWRMACVFVGVAGRYRRGALRADPGRAERFDANALRLVRYAARLLDQ